MRLRPSGNWDAWLKEEHERQIFMWDRKEIKAKGKAAFKQNYGSCVAVSFLSMLPSLLFAVFNITVRTIVNANTYTDPYQSSYSYDAPTSSSGGLSSISDAIGNMGSGTILVRVLIFALVNILIVLALNALQVGCYRFFMMNQLEKTRVSVIGKAFKYKFIKNGITILLMDILLVLISMLIAIFGMIITPSSTLRYVTFTVIIIGISMYLTYSWRMVPYILSEKPELGILATMKYSSKIMQGHKGKAFVYDLSFILWYIGGICTLGILNILYGTPYKQASDAELYLTLRTEMEAPKNDEFTI